MQSKFLSIVGFFAMISPQCFAGNPSESIELVLSNVLYKQHDGTLEKSGRFCTAYSEKIQVMGETQLQFSYYFWSEEGVLTGPTFGFSKNDPRFWTIDNTARIVRSDYSSSTMNLEIRYDENFNILKLKSANQDEWCALNP